MDAGQELTHTISTTVTATHQRIDNQTIFRDGEKVVLNATHTIDIPLGVTYDLSMRGDVNSAAVQRTFNVINRLVGEDVFSIAIENNASDPNLMPFTANYDPATMMISGTAYFESIVRLIFENGSSKKIVPSGDGTWSTTISELDLEYGENTLVLINGLNDSDILTISVTREIEIEEFNPAFTAQLNDLGQTVFGTVQDARAIVAVAINGVEVSEILPKSDLSWSYNFAPALSHGAAVTVSLKFDGEIMAEQDNIFYFKTAQLDQTAGQTISGLSNPDAEITVITEKYDSLSTFADAIGNWEVDFITGLPANAVVRVLIDDVELAPLTYIGPANVVYELTLEIVSSTSLKGTAKPETLLSITAGQQTTFTVLTDDSGVWMATLDTALNNGDMVSIVTPLSEIAQATYVDPTQPTFTATLIDPQTITGVELDFLAVKAVIDGVDYPAVMAQDGTWIITFDQPVPNVTPFYVTNGNDQITLRAQYLEASAVTTTQIEGIAENGQTVTIGGITAQTQPNGAWTVILAEPLKAGDTLTISSSSGASIIFEYVPPFTAYLKTDGLNIFGSSPEAQVEVFINFSTDPVAVVDVVDGDWTYTLDTALNNNDSVSIKSGIETKNLTYSSTMTDFTAQLNSELTLVTGTLSDPAKIRIVFDDNSILERDMASGAYTFDLGRTLVVGEVIVVACITNDTMYDAKTIYAEAASGA